MLAYSKVSLDHKSIVELLNKWRTISLATPAQVQQLEQVYPVKMYTPNIFIRIGLFIFTLICLSAINGFLLLITGFAGVDGSALGLRLIIHGLLPIAALEFLIKEKGIYRSGIDDALLYTGIISIISGFCFYTFDIEMREIDVLLIYSLISLPFLVVAAIRYLDMLATFTSLITACTILFIVAGKLGEYVRATMPFIMMAFSIVVYLVVVRQKEKQHLRFWEDCFWVLEVSSLVLFYIAGNYFVVRTISEELFSLDLAPEDDIPMAFFFYIYTALIPIAYIFYGLKNKNRVLFRLGLLLIAASVLTFKYYFSLGHHEVTMTIAGILLITAAWYVILLLKEPRMGISYKEDKEEDLFDKIDGEALILVQTFSGEVKSPENNTNFGEGSFGGAGAEGNY